MRNLSKPNWLIAAAFVGGLGAVAFAAAPAFADGGSNPADCKDGENCNRQLGASDRQIYNAGYWLAQTGRYDAALRTLRTAQNQNHPAILNYIGFSMRKLGDVDGALVQYKKAIEISPDFTLARAYMGEAYLQKGDAASAKAQLSQIRRRCGTNCQEYAKLALQIEDYMAARGMAGRRG